LQFTEIFITYANLNELLLQIFPVAGYPSLIETVSVTEIRLRLLEFTKCFWLYPNFNEALTYNQN